MKRHLILLLLAGIFSFTSCSNDDDGTDGEPILGTWAMVDINPPVIDPSACSQDSTITFNADNTTESDLYLASNDCQLQQSSDTWQNNGNSQYQVTIPGLGTFDGQVNFTSSNRFIFSSTYQGVPFAITFDKR